MNAVLEILLSESSVEKKHTTLHTVFNAFIFPVKYYSIKTETYNKAFIHSLF